MTNDLINEHTKTFTLACLISISSGATPVQQRYLGSSHVLHAVHINNIYKHSRKVMYTENISLFAIFLVPNALFFYI